MRRARRNGASSRTGLAIAIALGTGVVGADARAGDALGDLRLFISPERRARLDAELDVDPVANAREAVASTARTASPAAGPAGSPRLPSATRPAATPASRTDAPRPGSAVLRSSRGVSRIVDGMPSGDGPS